MLSYAPDAGKFMKQGIIFCNSEIAVAVDVSLVLQVNLSVVTLLLYSGCKVLGSFVHRKLIAVTRGHTCLLSHGQCLMAIGHKLGNWDPQLSCIMAGIHPESVQCTLHGIKHLRLEGAHRG